MRKYVCDNCGKELVEIDLYVATAKRQGDSRFTRTTVPDEVVLGEFCLECLRKWKEFEDEKASVKDAET